MCIIRVRPSSDPSASITGEQSNVSAPSRSNRFRTATTPNSRALAANASVIGPGTGSAEAAHAWTGRRLRIERLERQLGKGDHLRARARRRVKRAEAARDVVGFVRAGMLLDQSDAHNG